MSLPTLYDYYTNGGINAGLSSNNSYFTLNNKNITIYSGALHYFRVPQQYWRDRLQKLKAAGLNTVETYVPWNLHEPKPGVYDFGNGGTDFQDFLNIEKFLKTAQEEELFAIVRPGPYICAEWEYGGLPSWLLREEGIKLRSSDDKYMKPVERYFKVLFAILSVFQFTKGGPIIGFQIENEFGNLMMTRDKDYLVGLKKIFLKYGLKEQFFTSDSPMLGRRGQIPGVLYTANFQSSPTINLALIKGYQRKKPSMVMEYWSGWFDHWTEKHNVVDVEKFSHTLRQILEFPSSVNFYMFHGGTNFGFMNGANKDLIGSNNKGYKPVTSSYDYDAPLNEIGDYTDKYYEVKKLIAEFNKVQVYIPPLPKLIKREKLSNIKITSMLSLNDLIKLVPEKVKSHDLTSMELLPINNNTGQSYGYIVYRKAGIDIEKNSVLKIEGKVFDTIMVLINGKLKSKILTEEDDLNEFGFWNRNNAELDLGDEEFKNATLDLVVENSGRIHFGRIRFGSFIQHKGLWQGNVTLNRKNVRNWQIIPLEFKKKWTNSLTDWRKVEKRVGPTLYKAQLQVTKPVDTFVNMEDWNKGIVIVNGFVLSRYLWLGPQQALYLPAPFLRKGSNDILVFEHFTSPGIVKFSNESIYKTNYKRS